jgi:phosphatidate cytidylyltransferase
MKQRIISAIIFVVAMLGGIFGGPLAFFSLFTLIVVGCLWELMGLLFSPYDGERLLVRKVCGSVVGVVPFLIYSYEVAKRYNLIGTTGQWMVPRTYDPLALAAVLSSVITLLLILVFLLFIVELFLKSERPFSSIGHYLIGVVYIGVPFTLLINIAFWNDGYAPMRVFGLLLLTWTNDTMAYFTGSFIGKTPFFKRISPKKTWEGTLGGVFFTFAMAWVLSLWVKDFSLTQWLVLAGCAAVFGTLGDLVESMLKRSVNIKDSGDILPGHGGFLDRFDAFIFALPFSWLALMVLQAVLLD